ncbi:MAG TPA: heavy metal-associated domain-containing protein [Selenomonadales bacterium]|nr:heavy metal-associated domain-containing protein [Selenomonadales bacterium]
MDWSNLGYLIFFGAMAFMMLRGGGCCGGGHQQRGADSGQAHGGNAGAGGCCGSGHGEHNNGYHDRHDKDAHESHDSSGSRSVSRIQLSKKLAENFATTHFVVGGMTCQHCAGMVEKSLLGKAGVSSAKVSLPKIVEVTFDPEVVKVEDLKQVVREAGYLPE